MTDIPDNLPVDEDVFLEMPNLYGFEPEEAELEHISPILRHLAYPVDELHRDPENAKDHPEDNRELVAHSIRKYGQRDLIVVRAEDKTIEAGNLRHRVVSEDLGHDWIAVSFEDDDPLTATTFALVDNRSAELAEWNEKLQPVLESLDVQYDFDLSGLGFGEGQFDDLEFDYDDLGGADDGDEDDDKYVDKMDPPIYEPTGEQPDVDDLCDREKTEQLLAEIDDADLPPDVESFLRHAAERHTKFDFEQIAEYYAHAPEDVQRLFEHSALVIIDIEQAIEQGFTQLTKRTLQRVGGDDE